MKGKEVISLTRQQLYDEVWKQSLVKVAQKYNLHYGRLISSLKQANVPYPPSGYWTRVDFGKDVSTDLVPLSGDVDVSVELTLAGAVVTRKRKKSFVEEEKVEKAVQPEERCIEAMERLKEEAPTVIPFSTNLDIPDTVLYFLTTDEKAKVIEAINSLEIKQNAHLHKNLVVYKRAIKEYKDYLKEHNFSARNRNYYDRGKTVEPPRFINDVSEDGLSRAILIMDVIFKTVEKLGGEVQQDLSVKIRQDVVHFKFAEAQDKVPHEITKQEAKELLEYKEAKRYKRYASEPKIKKYDNVYNGKLRIVFDDSSYIKDSVELKLEEHLDEIIIRLYEISNVHRIEREKREEQHSLYLEAKLREEEVKERRQQEAVKTQALENIAKDYRIACEIRNYITAILNKGELTEADFEWIEWAKKKADWYDPIVAREDEYLGKRDHSRSDEDKMIIKKKQSSIYGW